MINKLEKENYITLMIKNSNPQPNRSKWTKAEDDIINQCILKGLSLTDISKIISLRTSAAIRTRANHLGYGFYRSKKDDLTYFHSEINHKHRRTNDEMLKEWKKIPIKSTDSIGIDIEVTSNTMPKVEIAVAELDKMIKMLTAVRSSHEQH